MRTRKKNKGFTLIELLVVIAIIGILSAVVMNSLQPARQKAGNAAINEKVLQYLNAIELYHTATGSYPIPDTANGQVTDEYCLGDYKNIGSVDIQACGLRTTGFGTPYQRNENSTLAAALDNYMKSLPMVNTKDITWNTSKYLGAIYKCENTLCSTITIKWWLDGTTDACARGVTPIDGVTGRYCEYTIN